MALQLFLLTFGDAIPLFLESSSYSLVPEQTIHGTVTPLRTTQDVPTRIKHIQRKTDQSSVNATVDPAMTPSLPIERNNSTKRRSLNVTDMISNGTTLEPAATEKIVIRHIPREKRAVRHDAPMPFSFDTLHSPCEFDITYTSFDGFTPHCRWQINNRFTSAQYYRYYMLTKSEAWFFGQYEERLRRYEMIPPIFHYDWDI